MSDTSTGDQKLRVCKLAEAALLGEATTDQIAELEQLVTQDDEAREFYVRYIHDANNLRDFATASSVPEGAAELIDREFLARLWREDAMVAKSAARPKAFAVVIVLALTLTVGVGFWFMRAPPPPLKKRGFYSVGRSSIDE